ncbi:MAG: KH domain-containing protein [Erysipelotrichaceae bacterium]|nr:KH domain-containing protein [Erysipelotrichaceae bacterium]
MADLVVLTEYLVKRLVADPDMISVKQIDNEDSSITILVLVPETDMARVIGRGGVVANSIRTLVQAAAYVDGKQKVFINIDSI